MGPASTRSRVMPRWAKSFSTAAKVEPVACPAYCTGSHARRRQCLFALARAAPSPAMTQSGSAAAPICSRADEHGVEHDPHGRAFLHARQVQVSSGSSDRTDAGEHGIVRRAHEMDARGGPFAGPHGLASRQRDLFIRRTRQKVTFGRPSCTRRMWPARCRASSAPMPTSTKTAASAMPPMAGARDLGIGIDQRRNHARDAGRDDRVGAWRRLAVMRAGLERA